MSANLVVIDDLGLDLHENLNAVAKLEYCLRKRYENNKATILVTNMTKKDLVLRYSKTLKSMIDRACPKILIVNTDQWRGECSEY